MNTPGAARAVVLKRIGILSVAMIYGAMSAVIGLLIGIGVGLSALVGITAVPDAGGAMLGALFGVGALIFAPVVYGALGFVGGAISAALYNLFAAIVGGVKLELE